MLQVLSLDDPDAARFVDRVFSLPEEAARAVDSIIARVRAEGDMALCAFTAQFDKVQVALDDIAVAKDEIDDAYAAVSAEFVAAIRLARQRIFDFHAKKVAGSWQEVKPDGTVLGQLVRPLERVGVYVPGGRARYPSSVLMNVVPARAAGVGEVVMVTPPGPEGKIDPHVLVAAQEAGVDRVFRVGGAQAVAALAFGTKRIPRVDKIVGPGNVYVTLAKRAVFGVVGIDILAGPSEVVVVADETADPRYVAADLLAQAEHDPDAQVLLVTTSRDLASRVNEALQTTFTDLGEPAVITSVLAHAAVLIAPDMAAAVNWVNRFAPEHLELMVAEPFAWLSAIKNAGAVFLGPYSPVPMGDYIAGPNHVLPTGGTARFFSPLGVEDFIKRINLVSLSPEVFADLAAPAALLASVEGLSAHRMAVLLRKRGTGFSKEDLRNG
ncbi:MAG TPA: histidinol dehydrogenase [Desulfotomaculum sp.]|nr:histidinol dehydrogenase [Desulfotomaculum sp.]